MRMIYDGREMFCDCGKPAEIKVKEDGSYPFYCRSCNYFRQRKQILYMNRGR